MQVEVQQATKVQVMAETQWRAIETERCKSKAIAKRRCVILDITTFSRESY
jgi:hypothetical protein